MTRTNNDSFIFFSNVKDVVTIEEYDSIEDDLKED